MSLPSSAVQMANDLHFQKKNLKKPAVLEDAPIGQGKHMAIPAEEVSE
jgi:hypothetical protein